MTNSYRSGLLAFIAMLSVLFLGGCSSTQTVVRQSKAADERVATYDAFTARVTAKANPDLRMMMLKIAASPLIDARDREALLVESVLAGSGGSAFNVLHPDDHTTWVITNRHVIEQMEEVKLTYGRGNTEYPAEIVYYDDDVDVAVLSVKAYLPLADMGPAPAETGGVLALGYPGVGPSQLFQVTSGTVANECFRFSDVQRGMSRACLTQHTAAIDHGSSGGPLLDAATGRVIGINSYGVAKRFLAVPSSEVVKVLAKAKDVVKHQGEAAWMRHELENANERFFAEMQTEFGNDEALARTVSPLLTLESGFIHYLMWNNRAKYMIAGYEGMTAAMRVATIIRISEDLEEADGVDGKPSINPSDNLSDPDVLVRVSLRTRAEKHPRRETRWRFEFGHWRIVDYTSPDMQKADEAFLEDFIARKSAESDGAQKAGAEWQKERHAKKCQVLCEKGKADEDSSCKCEEPKAKPEAPPACDKPADKPAGDEAKPGDKPAEKPADAKKPDPCGPSAAPTCSPECPNGPAEKPADKPATEKPASEKKKPAKQSWKRRH